MEAAAMRKLTSTCLSLALAALLPSSVLAPLPDSAPPLCLWMSREEVTDAAAPGPADCVARCHEFCRQHIPGEYLCTGRHVHTDDDDYKHDATDDKKYSYCFCTRSIPIRQPGLYCGLGKQLCPSPPLSEYVDGQNNMMAGVQGDLAVNISARSHLLDQDVAGPCQDELYSTLRHMFLPEPLDV